MKKKSKLFLTAVVCLVAAVLSVLLLGMMLFFPSGKSVAREAQEYKLENTYQRNMENRLLDAVSDITSVKKKYWIPENASAAPQPRREGYGQTNDPEELRGLLERAREVLEGQSLFFDPEMELFPGSEVHYYLDETILAITWKQAIDGMAVTFSEVKLMDPSQFRRYVAGDEFASGKLMLTTEMSQAVNAVVACSGDYYGYRPDGSVVYAGRVMRTSKALPDICYVDQEGDLILARRKYFDSVEEHQAFVEDHHIRFSLSFGPNLVMDGKACPMYEYPIGEMEEHYTRAALGQRDRLHYLYIACNKEGDCLYTPDIGKFARLVATTGCSQVYNLDGGQTATVVMDNQVINQVNYGSQRRISDIIYFATAMPGKE